MNMLVLPNKYITQVSYRCGIVLSLTYHFSLNYMFSNSVRDQCQVGKLVFCTVRSTLIPWIPKHF